MSTCNNSPPPPLNCYHPTCASCHVSVQQTLCLCTTANAKKSELVLLQGCTPTIPPSPSRASVDTSDVWHMARHRHVVTGTNPRQEALAQPAKTPRQAVSRTLQHPDNRDDAPRKLFVLMKAWEAQHLNAHKGDCFRQEASDRCQGFSDHLPPGCTTAASIAR
jgi:hypothetical protein